MMSFSDQQTFKDRQKELKNIIQQCWYISDRIHTSYTDVLNMSVLERQYLIDLSNKKEENTYKAIESIGKNNNK